MNWEILKDYYACQENTRPLKPTENQLHPVQVLKLIKGEAELDDDDGFRLNCLPVKMGEDKPKVGERNAHFVFF